METSRDMNNAVSISERWIYYSSYKIAVTLIKWLLDIICSPSKYDKGMYAEF